MSAFNKQLIGLLFIPWVAISAFAQTDSVALSEEYYNLGMEVFNYTQRAQAKELFVQATQMNPKSAKAQFMAGQSIMLTVNKEKSLQYFRKAWELDPAVDEDILYFLGQGYHQSLKFDSAILFYDKYNRMLARSLSLEKSNKINEVNRKIFECRNAVIFVENPVDVEITNLGENINSEYPDYAPTINSEETLMVFTSRRPDGNRNSTVAQDLEYYEDIFYSEYVDGKWQPSKDMQGPLNTNYHNSSVAISHDGQEMIIYQDGNGGDLLVSKKGDAFQWSTPKSMEGINSEYLENSASLSADNKTLFFTSDRPGGYGGTDIYRAELGKGNRWGNIQNLGPLVNTEMDEDGVFITTSGKYLYFSSNGHAGMGDMDLYRTTLDTLTGTWSEPVNLGYPINSPENDIYFVLNADETFAYISSVRQDNIGEQDIYKVDMRNWKPVNLGQENYADLFAESSSVEKQVVDQNISGNIVSEVLISLVVQDAVNAEPLNAQVYLRNNDGNKQNLDSDEKGVYNATVKTSASNPQIYKLEINTMGYTPQTASLYLGGISSTLMTFKDTIRMQRLAVNVPALIDIYFAHDSDEPLSFNGIQGFIDMMERSPNMKVEIGGHTDSLGPAEYNQSLSQRRANAVKKYLERLGISSERIQAVGYGESRPVAPNDSQEGRRLNRRTEFIILQQ